MAALFAATYPERTSALILFGSFARFSAIPDHPWAHAEEVLAEVIPAWAEHWGTPSTRTIDLMCPSRKGDEDYLRWLNHFERQAATPAGFEAIMRWNMHIDVRHVLPAIRVPTLVLHRTGDRAVNIESGRYLAEHIPGATFVELAGDDHKVNCGDSDAIVDEIESFLSGVASSPELDRMLATVLVCDVVDAKQRAAERGEPQWHDVLKALRTSCNVSSASFAGVRSGGPATDSWPASTDRQGPSGALGQFATRPRCSASMSGSVSTPVR